MPEVFYLLPSLQPENMLTLVVQFVETYPQYVQILRQVQAYKQPNAFAAQVTLRVPVITGWWGAKRRQQRAIHALCALYEATAAERVQRAPGVLDDDEWFSLTSAFFSLLRSPTLTATPEQQGYIATEKLLIGVSLSDDDAIKVFNNLREYATNVRPAVARVNGQNYFLYHVLDSIERFSTFQGAVRGGEFPNCRILDCYQTQALNSPSTYKLFLPEDYQLERAHMERIARLMLAAPEMFGALFTAPPRHNLLGFVDEDGAAGQGRFVFTANITFLHEAAVGRDYAFKHYDLIPLENVDQALNQLRVELERQNEQGMGYRVEMHHSRYSELRDHKREYERILQELEQLQERKADIESYSQLRPRLLRFTQKQLPRLIDVLRVVPPNKLTDVSYAFQSYTSQVETSHLEGSLHRQGLHFLYIKPEVRIDFLTPLLQEASEEAPLEFWLDPTWARFYLNQANTALVFVPKGRMLYPVMHSWDKGNNSMDEYLRHILAESITVPEHPIYIFDVDRHTDREVVISVLDRARFAPLNSPKYIKWINDNLLMLERHQILFPNSPTPEALIRTFADDSRTETFARLSQDRAAQIAEQYRDAAESSSLEMAKVTDELVKALDDEFNGIIQRGNEFISKAQALNSRLAEIKTLYETIRGQTSAAELEIATTDKTINGTTARVATLKHDVERTVEEARKATTDTQNQIDNQVEKLLALYDELLAKIEELDRAR